MFLTGTDLMNVDFYNCSPLFSDLEFVIQKMMLKQFQFKDYFISCLKAMEKGRKTSIAVCFS